MINCIKSICLSIEEIFKYINKNNNILVDIFTKSLIDNGKQRFYLTSYRV